MNLPLEAFVVLEERSMAQVHLAEVYLMMPSAFLEAVESSLAFDRSLDAVQWK